MNTGICITIAVIAAIFARGAWMVQLLCRRKASDVVFDLQDNAGQNCAGRDGDNFEIGQPIKGIFLHKLSLTGLYGRKERRRYSAVHAAAPLAGAALFVFAALLAGKSAPAVLIPGALAALAGGYLCERGWFYSRQARYVRELEFFLPVVMERLVMAVRSGLDVIAGLKAIIKLEKASSPRLDPVTKLLDFVCRLAEAGLGFEEALQYVAGLVDCTALRHAFLHLATAWSEGGELVIPLSELSDSTQLYYQESVEEDIAKLPVKATIPLLVTFAGLLICFITSPLVQVMGIMEKALPK